MPTPPPLRFSGRVRSVDIPVELAAEVGQVLVRSGWHSENRLSGVGPSDEGAHPTEHVGPIGEEVAAGPGPYGKGGPGLVQPHPFSAGTGQAARRAAATDVGHGKNDRAALGSDTAGKWLHVDDYSVSSTAPVGVPVVQSGGSPSQTTGTGATADSGIIKRDQYGRPLGTGSSSNSWVCKCGHKNWADSVYCRHCGESLATSGK